MISDQPSRNGSEIELSSVQEPHQSQQQATQNQEQETQNSVSPTSSSRQDMNDHLYSDNRHEKKFRFKPSSNTIVLLILFFVSVVLNGSLIRTNRRGFFCDDESIRYPILSDTVPFKLLIVICLIIPLVILRFCDRKLQQKFIPSIDYSARIRKLSDVSAVDGLTIEQNTQLLKSDYDCLFIKNRSPTIPESTLIGPQSDTTTINQQTHDMVSVTAFSRRPGLINFKLCHSDDASQKSFGGVYRSFMFGIILTLWFTGMGKIFIGRLRPHFHEKCKPDIDCSLGTNKFVYIENFNCTRIPNDGYDYFYITTSWPSGHASLIFFSMIYMIFYINSIALIIFSGKNDKLNIPTQLFINMAYLFMFALASYISYTRIIDYHHHSTDVASGAFIGSAIAIIWARNVNLISY